VLKWLNKLGITRERIYLKVYYFQQTHPLEKLIREIQEIIGDYRRDEGIGISIEHIEQWINQFDKPDREFILYELNHILKRRYISKEMARKMIKIKITSLAKNREYQTPQEFLKNCCFISHQPAGKSQRVLLAFVDEILKENFNMSLGDCNCRDPLFYIYFDDILCTGDTLFKAFAMPPSKGWYFQLAEGGKTNFDNVLERNAHIIWAYFSIHAHGAKSAEQRLIHAMSGRRPMIIRSFNPNYSIDNDISNPDSPLSFLWPLESIKDEQIAACETHITEKITKHFEQKAWTVPPKHFYRPAGRPREEVLFTSPADRTNFERIILKKSIDVYNTAKKDEPRMRPLGYGLVSDMNFGFGALIFTWRNVAFNVPMIFWYEHRGFIPLFKRNFISY
jgi:hypothetical protein